MLSRSFNCISIFSLTMRPTPPPPPPPPFLLESIEEAKKRRKHQKRVLQVQGAGFAMVGEQMPVSLVTVAADAVRKAEVAVKAEYLEGGGHSELQILVDNGDGTTQPLQVCCHDCLWTQ